MADEAKRSCENCKWALGDDYGYSNYTTEGTYFHCLKKLHPEDGFDMFYGEDKRLDFAQECSGFQEGGMITLDCDRDDVKGEDHNDFSAYSSDPEVAEAISRWNRGAP